MPEMSEQEMDEGIVFLAKMRREPIVIKVRVPRLATLASDLRRTHGEIF